MFLLSARKGSSLGEMITINLWRKDLMGISYVNRVVAGNNMKFKLA